MEDVTRRDAAKIMGIGLSSAAILAASGNRGMAQEPVSTAPAFAGRHEPKPLPFDPATQRGLSERLLTSHWENNYKGSVKALNMIEGQLAAAMRDTDLPPLVYGGLKREELHRTGSVILHEEYFASLGGSGKPAGEIVAALASAFGSIEAWQAEFKRTAMALAGGSGWSVLSYNLNTRTLRNHWAWDHMHAAVSSLPLLPLDMYEHAYHMDYGTAAAKYVDAFMDNVNWTEVDRRYKRAVKMAAT